MPEMNEIFELLKQHPRSENQWIGLEIERFAYRQKILGYEPDLRLVLEGLIREKNWTADYAFEGQVTAIHKNLHMISLEPGSQFEVSPAPRKTVQETQDTLEQIDSEIKSLAPAKDIQWLELGMNPWDRPLDRLLLPNPRYHLMNAHFQKIGKRGQEMMRLTTGLQINLDYQTDYEAVEMLRTAYRISPVLSAMFANSPYAFGKKTEHLSERAFVWKETDAARSGFWSMVFDQDFNLEKYCEAVARIPLMYAYDEEGNVFDPKGALFKDLPTPLKKKNALGALRQIFTEVRIKPCCVELRSFDQQKSANRYALLALVVGLLYDEENRFILRKKLGSVDLEQLEFWMTEGAATGLKSDTLYLLSKEFLRLAEAGLERRGYGEENFLSAAIEIIRNRKTPAEALLRSGEISW